MGHNPGRLNPDTPIVFRMSRDGWTFLTNHGHVLVCLAVEPDVLLRDVASNIGITERAVQQIVADLERAGVIVRLRVGRRNRYILRREEEFRHPVEAGVTVGELVDLVECGAASRRRAQKPRTLASSLSALDPTHLIDWASEAAQRIPGR
jgi:DNA-binding transcriptional ArsR family regulator